MPAELADAQRWNLGRLTFAEYCQMDMEIYHRAIDVLAEYAHEVGEDRRATATGANDAPRRGR